MALHHHTLTIVQLGLTLPAEQKQPTFDVLRFPAQLLVPLLQAQLLWPLTVDSVMMA